MEKNNSSQDFLNLLIPIPKYKPYERLGEWYVVNRITYPIAKFFATNRVTLFFIKKAHSFLNNFIVLNIRLNNYFKSIARLKNEKNNGKIDGYSIDSNYGYSGDVFLNELMTMYKYKKQIDEQYSTPSESKETYKHIIEKSSELIERIKPNFYLNFGVCYAYSDSILAKKYPNTKFIGTERTDSARLFNGLFFDLPNLQFVSGDIFDTLKHYNFKGAIFMHSRTLLLLPQTFVRDLYKAVYDAGFSHILATEQYGISRQLGQSYKFSYDYQDSVVYRDFMYIHNYPNILIDCGFKLNRIENFKTDHLHEDVRILSFEAERVD